MNLNRKQLAALWIGIAAAVSMFAFPPWKTGMGTYGRSWSKGYTFIASPPEQAVGIDIQRILLQFAAVVLLTGGAIVTMQKREDQ